MDQQQQQQPLSSSAPQTYVVGEDAGRLASAAKALGLQEARAPLRNIRDLLFSNDSTLTAARMHSVGALGEDEALDNSGTLHYVSVRRRQQAVRQQYKYGTLQDLFHLGEEKAPEEPMEMEIEEEELMIEENVEGGSLNAAIFGIIKGTVGPAILYLPRGFQVSGYAVAIPAMLFATFMYIYNAYRLLACWKVESDRNHKLAARIEEVRTLLLSSSGHGAAGYGSTTETATAVEEEQTFTPKFLTYPELARRALGSYAFIVELGISLMQFGVCLTYLIFVPQNLHECTRAVFGVQVPKIAFTILMVMIEIPLSWIRDIRKLTPTNVMATILIAFGLCSVLCMALVYGSSPETEDDQRPRFVANLQQLPAITDAWFIFIGTSFFMMEGSITLLVPLQEAVYLKQDRAKFPKVNQIVTTWIVVFYIFFSIICCAAFGKDIQTALTASLKGPLATVVQFAYSVAVILTFPLQAFPAMEVACKAILGQQGASTRSSGRDDTDEANESLRRNILATTLTCLLGVIAIIAIDYLGNVVSILGSLFGIPLALVFPPLMHNSLVKDSTRATKVMNYFVVGIGFLAMGAASFATIVSWDKGAEG